MLADRRTGEHVQHTVAAADRQVVHPIVGWDEDELTPYRRELGIAEERRRAQAGAVEDDGFFERQHLGPIAKLAHAETPAGLAHVAHRPPQEHGRLDEHRDEPVDERRREGMLAEAELGE